MCVSLIATVAPSPQQRLPSAQQMQRVVFSRSGVNGAFTAVL